MASQHPPVVQTKKSINSNTMEHPSDSLLVGGHDLPLSDLKCGISAFQSQLARASATQSNEAPKMKANATSIGLNPYHFIYMRFQLMISNSLSDISSYE